LRKRRVSTVGEIIETLKKTTKLGENLEQAQIWEHWPEIAGAYLSAHGRPYAVKDGQLRIAADSAVSMHRFSYRKWDIIKRVNRMAGKELIHDVFVLLADEDPAAGDLD